MFRFDNVILGFVANLQFECESVPSASLPGSLFGEFFLFASLMEVVIVIDFCSFAQLKPYSLSQSG